MKKVMYGAEKWIQSNIVIWLIVIVGILIHGLLCFGQAIWLDEALTGTYIRMGWPELLAFTTTDVHPPLYYFIVKAGITLLGDHIHVVKLFSFVPFVLMLAMTATKVKKAYGEKEAFVLLVFLCTTPCIINRNAEMRMYQWAMFFVFAFAVYLFEAVNSQTRKAWICTLVFGVLAAYTHYYALVAVAILYALVFFANCKTKAVVYRVLLNAVVSVIAYLPWLVVFLGQAKTLKETGWWQEAGLGLQDVYEFLIWPFEDRTGYEPVFFLLLLVSACVYVFCKKDCENRMQAMLCIGVYLLLILSGIMIIVLYQPVFITRFIYPTVGVLLFGLALIVSKWRTEVICVMSVLVLVFAAKTYNSQLHYQYNEDSVPALNAFMETVGEDALFICDQDAVKCIIEYLYPDVRVENDTDVDRNLIEDEKLYYFVCNESSLEEDRLETLNVSQYEYVGEISLMYHGFEIHEIIRER